MQTSRFQIAFIAALSVGLGFALASSQASGYPAGPVVSHGSNPVRSASGHRDLSGPVDSWSAVISAPADQDLILTEVVVGLTQDNQGCWASGRFELNDADGVRIATVPVHNGHMYNVQNQPVQIEFSSGINIPAGTVVDVEWNFVVHNCGMTSFDLSYILSGYLATP